MTIGSMLTFALLKLMTSSLVLFAFSSRHFLLYHSISSSMASSLYGESIWIRLDKDVSSANLIITLPSSLLRQWAVYRTKRTGDSIHPQGHLCWF